MVAITQLMAGLTKHVADIPQMIVGGQVLQNAAIVQLLQQLLAALTAVVAATDARTEALDAERRLLVDDQLLLDALRQGLRAMFRGSPTALSDFGLSARARAPLTSEQKVVMAAKAKATREARGTKGPKQRAAIHGDVTGVSITPVVAEPPAPESPQARPAPAASPKA